MDTRVNFVIGPYLVHRDDTSRDQMKRGGASSGLFYQQKQPYMCFRQCQAVAVNSIDDQTLNQRVEGSSPSSPTIYFKNLG